MAKNAAEGLRALAEQLEKDSSMTTATADRMAIDFFENRWVTAYHMLYTLILQAQSISTMHPAKIKIAPFFNGFFLYFACHLVHCPWCELPDWLWDACIKILKFSSTYHSSLCSLPAGTGLHTNIQGLKTILCTNTSPRFMPCLGLTNITSCAGHLLALRLYQRGVELQRWQVWCNHLAAHTSE